MFDDTLRAAKQVVAVFAHPDDAELSCFGTLRMLRKRGAEILLVVATCGETTRAPAAAGTRASEAALASSLLDAKLELLGLPDGHIRFDATTVANVELAMEQVDPDLVITHFPQERGFGHQDHATLAHVVTNVTLRRHPRATLVYAEPPALGHLFEPNLFVDVTDHFDVRLAAMGCHQTEQAKNFIQGDVAEHRARTWALRVFGSPESLSRRYEAFVVAKAMVLDPGAERVSG
jgi:N-acetylglucosamine malate deacetylase 1